LGLAYQILNDLQPFRSPATLANHEDMVDRIVTAPVVAVAENNQAQDAFSQLLHSAEVRQHAIRRCEVWVRQAVASARSHAAYTPAPIANVVEQFIAQHLTDPSVVALPTKAASMAQLTPMLAEA
jgi:geranylgeranyl pyrophosphate synthase